MSPADLRVRALELAIESADGFPTGATQHVAAAKLFLEFLSGSSTIVNVRCEPVPDLAALRREVEQAFQRAARER